MGTTWGSGTGYIFNPVLISLGLHPQVGSATGMYNTMLTSLSSTIVMALFGMINFKYWILMQLMTILGTVPGLYLQTCLVRRTGKTWITVCIIHGFLCFLLVSMASIQTIVVIHKTKEGTPLFEFKPYCS